MNLSAHIVDVSGNNVTFMLRDDESNKEIVRNYTRNDLPQLRNIIQSSQMYFLYMRHGTNAAEEYRQRSKEMQENMAKVIEQLEGKE